MLGGVCVLRSLALDWPAPLVALAAMLPVTLLDPWAVLQPGFWLSFAAVTWLMVSRPTRAPEAREAALAATRPGRLWAALRRQSHEVLRTQVIATAGLAPLALVAFQQVSLVGLFANLVAEPWVTLVVVPLALAGIAWPPAWSLAAAALAPLQHLLAFLARWPLASLHVAAAPAWMMASALAGGVVLMLPLPWRLRGLGLPLVLPLLAPSVPRPPEGGFELLAVDVGQGSALMVRTRSHLLVFDTGPRFGEAGDAGQRMLLPLLQARGERAIDLLVLSHADADHVGGARTLIDHWPVRALSSSLPPAHPLLHAGVPPAPCVAGQRWNWDGVAFEMLHPFPDDGAAAKTNARSCVLRVADARGAAALLTGDIEAPQEAALAALAARGAATLQSEILVVPHHGSRTSSTAAFIAAVRPRVAVMQLGYRNRYGHPAAEVVARYRAAGVQVVRSDTCGAWRWFDGRAACTRDERRRYWQWTAAAIP
jgi:competence protein ComEC